MSSHGFHVGGRQCLPQPAGSTGAWEFPSLPQQPQVTCIRHYPPPSSLGLGGSPPANNNLHCLPSGTAGEILQNLPHPPTRASVPTQKSQGRSQLPPSITTHEFCNALAKPAQELSFPLVGTQQVTQPRLSRSVQCREQRRGAKGEKFGPNAFLSGMLKPVES